MKNTKVKAPEEFETREDVEVYIRDRINRTWRTQSETNCIGTALFITGEIPYEIIVWNDRKRFFSLLKKAKKSHYGAIMMWHYPEEKFSHAGVITGLEPLLITYRHGRRGRILIDQPIERVDKEYPKEEARINLYTPRILEGLEDVLV